MGVTQTSKVVALIELNSPDFKVFYRNKIEVFDNSIPELKEVINNVPSSLRLLLKEKGAYDGVLFNMKNTEVLFMASLRHLEEYSYIFTSEPFLGCPEIFEFVLELSQYPYRAFICVHVFEEYRLCHGR